jgi:hypothetical protein
LRAALAGLKEQRAVEDAYGKLRPGTVAVKKCGRGKEEPRPTNKVCFLVYCHLAIVARLALKLKQILPPSSLAGINQSAI